MNTTHLTESINELCKDDFEWVKKRKKGYTIKYCNVASAFDIETSSFYNENNEKCSTMYIYVLGIDGKVKLGRTWEEFVYDIKYIARYYETNVNKRFVIYVHNLGYEFQFIRKLFEWEQVFSVDLRNPVYALTKDGIEFRCSYILSNSSLAKVGENLRWHDVEKKVGDLDYDLIRHSETPMTEKELGYVINDGLVVMAYIEELLYQYEDITKLPLTSTGFVRKFCRKRCIVGKDKSEYRQLIKKLKLLPEDYKMMKQAYQGGFTHANAFHVGVTHHNVASYDFTSSYPTVIVSEKFPVTRPVRFEITSKEYFYKCIKAMNCLMDLTFYDIDSDFLYETYISLNKCVEIEDYEINNGRVTRAKKLRIILTELDFKIIEKVYKWSKFVVHSFYIFQKGYLPKDLIMCVLQLYKDKTTLKGVEGKEEEYANAKALLNAIYGMTVTDPCKDESVYQDDGEWVKEPKDLESSLKAYNSSFSRFLYYAWGVWITAYARYNLWTGILELGKDYIYSDTDSVKILNREKHLQYFDNYNKEITRKLETTLDHYGISHEYIRPKNNKGVEKPLGVWDYEGTYKTFKTLGAKRYILIDENDELHITISGVNKKNGATYLKDTYKTENEIFKQFKDGLIFPSEYLDGDDYKNGNGKMTHTYIDCEREGYVIDYLGKKCYYKELSSVHLEKCDYEMSLSDIFKNYLMGIKEGFLLYD